MNTSPHPSVIAPILTRRAFARCLAAGLGLLVCGPAAGCTELPNGPGNEPIGFADRTSGPSSNDGTAADAEETSPAQGATDMAQSNPENLVRATLNGVELEIALEDNTAADALCDLLPLETTLSELNDNEKYVYLDTALPTDARNPGTIEKGDVMLYGDSCLVVFYETFATSYRYTRLGRVTDPDALDAIADNATVKAVFESVG